VPDNRSIVLAGLAAALAVATAVALASVLSTVFFAITVAYVAYPLRQRLVARGLPRRVAVTGVTLVAVSVVIVPGRVRPLQATRGPVRGPATDPRLRYGRPRLVRVRRRDRTAVDGRREYPPAARRRGRPGAPGSDTQARGVRAPDLQVSTGPLQSGRRPTGWSRGSTTTSSRPSTTGPGRRSTRSTCSRRRPLSERSSWRWWCSLPWATSRHSRSRLPPASSSLSPSSARASSWSSWRPATFWWVRPVGPSLSWCWGSSSWAFSRAVIRTKLAGWTADLPVSLYFVGFVGSVLTLGLIGFIAGPLLVALLVESLVLLSEGHTAEHTQS